MAYLSAGDLEENGWSETPAQKRLSGARREMFCLQRWCCLRCYRAYYWGNGSFTGFQVFLFKLFNL